MAHAREFHRNKKIKRIFNKKVIAFMRKCSKNGLTSIATKPLMEMEFGKSFTIYAVRAEASKRNIKFMGMQRAIIDRMEQEIGKKILKYIEKSPLEDCLELRDEIIIKFEKNVQVSKLKTIKKWQKIQKSQ